MLILNRMTIDSMNIHRVGGVGYTAKTPTISAYYTPNDQVLELHFQNAKQLLLYNERKIYWQEMSAGLVMID